jgi:hypothetical protein
MPNSFWVRNGQDVAKISLVAQVAIRGFEPLLYQIVIEMSAIVISIRPAGVVSSAAPTDFGACAVKRRNQVGAALGCPYILDNRLAESIIKPETVRNHFGG